MSLQGIRFAMSYLFLPPSLPPSLSPSLPSSLF
jgi:hypothetical protein